MHHLGMAVRMPEPVMRPAVMALPSDVKAA
jgi:hypothetical protein